MVKLKLYNMCVRLRYQGSGCLRKTDESFPRKRADKVFTVCSDILSLAFIMCLCDNFIYIFSLVKIKRLPIKTIFKIYFMHLFFVYLKGLLGCSIIR